MCMAEIVRSHCFERFDLAGMRHWSGEMLPIARNLTHFASPSVELAVFSSMAIVEIYTNASPAVLEFVTERALRLLAEAQVDASARLDAATLVLWRLNLSGDFALSAWLTRIGDACLNRAEVSDLMRTSWLCARAWWQAFSLHDAAAESYHQALRIAQSNGLAQAEFMGCHLSVFFRVMWHELSEAEALLDQLERLLTRADAGLPVDGFHGGALQLGAVFIHKARGDSARAVHHARLAWTIIRSAPSPYFVAVWGSILSDAFTTAGEYTMARQLIDEVRRLKHGTAIQCLDALLLLQEAYLAHCSGDDARASTLGAQGLRNAAEDDRQRPFLRWMMAGAPAVLMAQALDHDIEVNLVRRCIDEWRLPAPDGAGSHWPWPIRVQCLGEFQLLRRDIAVSFSRKAPRRLLQVLQFLVAQAGAEVPVATLVDELWPDLDGDAGAQALDVAIRRLRDLLGSQDSVRQRNGLISLNGQMIWTDVAEFDRLVRLSAALTEAQADRLIELYRGEFLAQAEALPWIIQARKRLGCRFRDSLTACLQSLEEQGHSEASLRLARAATLSGPSDGYFEGWVAKRLDAVRE